MGRFFASILFLAACGDNLSDDNTHDPGGTNTGGDQTTLPRTYPEVCGFASWTTSIAGDPGLHVSVVRRPYGAAVIAVPSAGGTLTGFAVDDRMNIMSDPGGTKIAIDDTFSSVSASIVDNRLIASAVGADSVTIAALDDDLNNPQQVAKLPGTHIAEPAFFHTYLDNVVAVGGADGVELTQFDANWHPTMSRVVGPSAAVTAMAATQYGNSILAAWSTEANQCHIGLISGLTPGMQSHTGFPCMEPHIAGDVNSGTAKIVFEGKNDVRLMHVAHTQMGGDSIQLHKNARAPRVVFDGHVYWVSYIDIRGDIIVGYLDGNSHLWSMSLVGPKPDRDAYDLVMVDNHPWVFAADPTSGYTAHRMCLTTSWD